MAGSNNLNGPAGNGQGGGISKAMATTMTAMMAGGSGLTAN